MPINMIGEQWARWKNNKGGVLYRDIFKWTNEKEHGKYLSMESGDEKFIIRLIDEDEIEDFQARKLVHGKIKDKSYMILSNLSKNLEEDGYIKENLEEEDILSENSMIINPPNIPQEDDEAGSGKSISLFDD